MGELQPRTIMAVGGAAVARDQGGADEPWAVDRGVNGYD
jgi:hypothetical protein